MLEINILYLISYRSVNYNVPQELRSKFKLKSQLRYMCTADRDGRGNTVCGFVQRAK